MALGGDGVLHAIFTEQPDHGKPFYVYYRASTDGGKTWSDSKNLSDDESGHDAGFARAIADGKGRIYVVWKYVAQGTILDGPGGCAAGKLVYRALDGGAWSKRILLGDDKVPTFSWFATLDPAGKVHVVWSQMAKDALAATSAHYWYCNLVRKAQLDGSEAATKDIIVPKALLTKEEQDKIKAKGKVAPYEDTMPAKEGLINLRGYVDASGTAHFVAEHPGKTDGPTAQQTGKQIVHWDGKKLKPIYEFEKYQTYNTFNDPPALVLDAKGKEHLIRWPEKAESSCVRDSPIEDGALGDPTDIIVPKTAKGALTRWQVTVLPGGKVAVTAGISEKGGYNPDDLELMLSIMDGEGKWSAPVCVTENAARKTFSSKATGTITDVSLLETYSPRHATVVIDKDGHSCLLMVNSTDSLAATTTGGHVTGSVRTASPTVFFVRL